MPLSFFVNGFINMIKFLGWSQIPYFILFVPIGFILFLKNLQHAIYAELDTLD